MIIGDPNIVSEFETGEYFHQIVKIDSNSGPIYLQLSTPLWNDDTYINIIDETMYEWSLTVDERSKSE